MGKRKDSRRKNKRHNEKNNPYVKDVKDVVIPSWPKQKAADDDDNGFFNGCSWMGEQTAPYTPYVPKPKLDPAKKLMLEKLMVAHYIEDIPEDCKKSIAYVMQGNGIYERRKNKLGTFISKIVEGEIIGLKSDLEEGWELNVPKIPAPFLGTTVHFFKKIYKKYSSEVFLQFFFDLDKEEYVIHLPKQTVSAASVRYDNDESFEDTNKILVFEIHSHGSMGAFFSGTDDGDEKADRFYGVIGNITHAFPDLKMRISVGGRTSEIEVEDLFDFDEEMYHLESYPRDWANRIKEQKAQVFKGGWQGNKFQGQRGVNNVQGGPYHQRGGPYQGHNQPWNNQNANSFVPDKKPMDLVDKFKSGDHLMPKEEFVAEDESDEKEYWMQEGDKLWRMEGDQKLFYVKGGATYWPNGRCIDDKTTDGNPNMHVVDHRGKRF